MVFVYAIYVASPVKVQTDSIWTIPVVANLLREGSPRMDAYRPTFVRMHHGVYEHQGHAYNFFPLGVSLAALPFVAVFDQLVHAGSRWVPASTHLAHSMQRWELHFHAQGDIDYGYFNVTETLIASFYTAGAAALVFLTARRKASLRTALSVAFIFAFGTSAFSTASRVMWQHGPSLFAVAATIYWITRPSQTRASAAVLGFSVAASYLFRPTNSLTVIGASIWMLWKVRRWLLPYGVGASIVAVPFCLYNWMTYQSPLPPYYASGRLQIDGPHFREALLGNLISPARGLFVFSPILILSFWGIARKIVGRRLRAEEGIFATIPVLHWMAVSSFPHWWGGDCFGPRFFTDVLPYLAYFLIEPVDELWSTLRTRPVRATVFGVLAGISFAIHAKGANSWQTHWWNDGPPKVDVAPSRLWDWRDLQFLRGTRWAGYPRLGP
jgi:hypothetical protein